GNVETAALVAEHVTPPAGAGRLAGGISAKGYGTGARDHDDARRARGSAGERDQGVGCDDQFFRSKNPQQQSLLVRRAAAHAETGGFEFETLRIEPCGTGGQRDAVADGARELVAPLGR